MNDQLRDAKAHLAREHAILRGPSHAPGGRYWDNGLCDVCKVVGASVNALDLTEDELQEAWLGLFNRFQYLPDDGNTDNPATNNPAAFSAWQKVDKLRKGNRA